MLLYFTSPYEEQGLMNLTATYTDTPSAQATQSHYKIEEQADGQLLFQTYPASRPTFVFDSAVIVFGFAFTILGLDYFLLGARFYGATLVLTALGAGATWLCLKILHRERRKGVRPHRFYVSNQHLNIPPSPDSKSNSTTLVTANIDRLVIRSTVSHTETTAYGFGKVGQKGAEARDKRTAWFADHSYILEAQSGGRGYLLANGLDETTAYGLMTAVSRKLSF
jgi:hypothetical protein